MRIASVVATIKQTTCVIAKETTSDLNSNMKVRRSACPIRSDTMRDPSSVGYILKLATNPNTRKGILQNTDSFFLVQRQELGMINHDERLPRHNLDLSLKIIDTTVPSSFTS